VRTMIRVLGPVAVQVDGVITPIGSRHARTILAVLASAGGRTVPVDRLRDTVWPDRPPPSAESSLLTYVSRIRRILGTPAVERVERGYRLAPGAAEIDAVRFERLVTKATDEHDVPERCRAFCRAALGLWRGPAFGDLGDDDAFRLEATRLDELRLTAMELSLAAEVALGRHELAVAKLETAVQEHPYREHLWHLLIESLRLDGRRIEAVGTCDALRSVLADSGLTPDPRLLELERRILADPAEQH